MKIKFLVINGSERTNGNTEFAINIAKEILINVSKKYNVVFDVINLRELSVKSCNTCEDVENCNYRTEPCRQNDDVVKVYEKMKEADCLIYATPVHGFGMPSLMQSFIDRLGVGYLRFERPLTNKIGGIIAVGRRYAHSAVFTQLIQNFLLNRMIVVGSGFPVYLYGGQKGEIQNDTEGLDSLYRMLIRMLEFAVFIKLKKTNIGIDKEILLNERDFIYSIKTTI